MTGSQPLFNSLRWRLLASAGLILLFFILLTGLALNQALGNYTRHAEYDRLQGLIYSLLGAADIDASGQVTMALDRVPAPRLQQPDSGLIATLHTDGGKLLWQSPSLLSATTPPAFPGIDRWSFHDHPGFTLTYGLEWVMGEGDEDIQRLTVAVTDVASPLQSERAQLGYRLWLWLLLISAVLLAALGALMVWGLKPLRTIRWQLDRIRKGTATRLSGNVPSEIQPLTQSINTLLEHQQRQQSRFRNALADLAHSLKTPLAVMKSSPLQDPQLQQQVDRIDDIISYQLKRAASAGVRAITPPLTIKPTLLRLKTVLEKVYADKKMLLEIDIPPAFTLKIAADDLMELCGNLLDNAAKHGHSRIIVHAEGDSLLIDDNGPGFPADTAGLLRRGQRADSRSPGQGIGLAVADDIAHAYGLTLKLTSTPAGGGRVRITPTNQES